MLMPILFWKSRNQGQGRYKDTCEKLGTPYLQNVLNFAIKFEYVIDTDAEMTFTHHEGHKVLRSGSNQGHV